MNGGDHDSLIWTLIGIAAMLGLLLAIVVARYNSRHRSPDAPRRRERSGLSALAERYGARLEGSTLAFEREGVPVEVSQRTFWRDGSRFTTTRCRVGQDLAALNVTSGSSRLWLGDATLDGVVDIKGDPALAFAVLVPDARRRLRELVLQGFELQRGTLEIERSNDWVDDLPGFIELAIPLARMLAPPPDLDARLLERLASEPLASVRRHLARALPQALGASPRLREVLANESSPAVVLAAALATGSESLWAMLPEPKLRELLRDDDDTTQVHAALALGHRGTAESVPALRTYEDVGGPLEDAARDSIAAIQSRVGGGHGGLALAHGDGALSLAEEQGAR